MLQAQGNSNRKNRSSRKRRNLRSGALGRILWEISPLLWAVLVMLTSQGISLASTAGCPEIVGRHGSPGDVPVVESTATGDRFAVNGLPGAGHGFGSGSAASVSGVEERSARASH